MKSNNSNNESLVKNIVTLSQKVKKLALYSNFISKQKPLNRAIIKTHIDEIKNYIEYIEDNLNT